MPQRASSPIFENCKDSKSKRQMIRNGKRFNKIHRIPLISSATVKITCIKSPSSFWVQPKNHITSELVWREPTRERLIPLAFQDLRELDKRYCMAPLEDLYSDEEAGVITRQYGRARIIKVESPELVEIIYIDEGRREWVDSLCLAEMPDDFYYHPWQAIHCCLGGVVPLNLDEEDPTRMRWTETDVACFQQIVDRFELFKVVATKDTHQLDDNSKVNIVELYGLESSYTDPRKFLEIYIAGLLAAESFPTIIQSPLFNAAIYEKPLSPLVNSNITVSDPRFTRFPLNWLTDDSNPLDRRSLAQSSENSEGWGMDPRRTEFQVPTIDLRYLKTNGYQNEDGTVSFHILGPYMRNPYEFYGVPLRKMNSETGELFSMRDSFQRLVTERKELGEELDAFYSKPENRSKFSSKTKEILSCLNLGVRFYAIYSCSQMQSHKRFGKYQRVEIIATDGKEDLMIRFLDTGGTANRVDIKDIYQIHPRHCKLPAMSMQLCWHGVRDEDMMSWTTNNFHPSTLKAFKEKFYTDGPVRLTLWSPFLESNYKKRKCRYGKEPPIPFEMWNVCFCTKIELSPTLTKKTNLFEVLNSKEETVESRLVLAADCPVDLGDLGDSTGAIDAISNDIDVLDLVDPDIA